MRSSLVARLLLHKTSRAFHGTAKRGDPEHLNLGESFEISKWKAALKEELEVKVPKDRQNARIYRVPINMREVQPNAYTPNIISIGPYHHGEERLQEMEELKWEFFRRLFRLERPKGAKLDSVMKAMEDLEQDARGCYWDKAEQHSSDQFVRMMLFDGCFIVELLRELKQNNFHHARSVKRWMLPTLRRDLIMLENQIPLFVLQKLFELTRRPEEPTTSLEDLALCFFKPLLQREPNSDVQSSRAQGIEKSNHFLDLFRLSILPRYLSRADEAGNKIAEEGTNMMRSMTELMEAGVVIEKAVNYPPLDIRSEQRWVKIPPLYIDDYKGTLFRNMVAYEQCHPECKPYVTSYLFFFDGLINSAHDVELLHHKGVLHHSLGNNKEVARLVNGLCKEIARDAGESYLHKVVADVNSYYGSSYAKIRARLVHHYFSSWVVGISTFGAIVVLYLTLLQTGFTFVGDPRNIENPFHHYLIDCMLLPVCDLFSVRKDKTGSKTESHDDSEIKHWLVSI
ncbi:hypothetical protein DITRI_Ditri01bG0005200 [Diplodiscus trichospermus]